MWLFEDSNEGRRYWSVNLDGCFAKIDDRMAMDWIGTAWRQRDKEARGREGIVRVFPAKDI